MVRSFNAPLPWAAHRYLISESVCSFYIAVKQGNTSLILKTTISQFCRSEGVPRRAAPQFFASHVASPKLTFRESFIRLGGPGSEPALRLIQTVARFSSSRSWNRGPASLAACQLGGSIRSPRPLVHSHKPHPHFKSAALGGVLPAPRILALTLASAVLALPPARESLSVKAHVVGLGPSA